MKRNPLHTPYKLRLTDKDGTESIRHFCTEEERLGAMEWLVGGYPGVEAFEDFGGKDGLV